MHERRRVCRGRVAPGGSGRAPSGAPGGRWRDRVTRITATLGPAPVRREELATWPSDQLTFGLAARFVAKFVAGARVTLRQVLELELIQMS